MRRRLALATAALAVGSLLPLVSQASTAPLVFTTTVLSKAGGEPNVAVSPDGETVLVDGLNGASGQPAALFRSLDGGRHFSPLKGIYSDTGGGDYDLRWLDNTHVIAVDLSLTSGIFVHRSADRGTTWKTSVIHSDVYDRPWVEHYRNQVFVIAKGFDAVPYAYVSADGGATFGSGTPLYGTGAVPAELGGTTPTPVDAFVTNQNAYVDHVAVDPRSGRLSVLYGIDSAAAYGPSAPLGNPTRLYVATRQEDGGFLSHPVYLGGAGDAFIDGFNWLSYDNAGTLYALGNGLHAGHESAWLSYSKNGGVTWSKLVDLGRPGATNVYGSIAGGDRGVLSLVTLRGSNTDPSTKQSWYVEISRVTSADSAHPTVERTRPLAKAIHTSDICFSGITCGLPGFGDDRNLLDYIWNAVGPDGTAHVVIASDGPATGSDGSRVDVVYLRQTSGARHGKGVPS